ncbi:MAG: 50S ribosomal protein L19 [Candidatus Omnitrophica bacterium CG11_big_fil_rev_8_21_14_0_20_45_26]|uniref:50S ribosomal protein L19 n=1 Tax=Candidatus Abzuiibacterium crystallinum TaxID=1974748 RepID=A0A2H0LME4_9BACT|nr:MAG: 50S ribosomal protein L19 [Candidatus Omnitrophica bacterium CG11_big_fil_rev_8_21_14_0_20_45_26]PIW63708.1 MAG: 50S ribosomal protein L19 [Candidatus Omnitrophica bacterium CG12_big_fil_rev_8_21_14_0_65_45_16]
MSKIELIEKTYLKKDLPNFKTGDTVQVSIRVKEGDKTRLQSFEGIVIRRRGQGMGASFTVLRDARGDIVEKIFPLHSPSIEKIKVIKKGNVRRSRLYYLRQKKAGTA